MPKSKTTTSLSELRKKTGLNQLAFWSPLGVTQSGGSRYESGRSVPKPVKKLLDIKYGTAAARNAALRDLGVQAVPK